MIRISVSTPALSDEFITKFKEAFEFAKTIDQRSYSKHIHNNFKISTGDSCRGMSHKRFKPTDTEIKIFVRINKLTSGAFEFIRWGLEYTKQRIENGDLSEFRQLSYNEDLFYICPSVSRAYIDAEQLRKANL